jgi:hypothetical protein
MGTTFADSDTPTEPIARTVDSPAPSESDSDTELLVAIDGQVQVVDARVVTAGGDDRESKRARRSARLRRLRTDLLVYAGYLAVAVWITSRLWPVGGHHVSAVDANDQAFFEWMLSHGARVVTHFDSPLFTDRINVPTGVNLMANTSILALSIPLAPITLWLGPAVSFAVLITLGLAGTAGAWYFVLSRHLVSSRSAAIVGGAIAGLGPGIVAHANGHPNLVAQFLVPFIAWRVIRLREAGRSIRNGLALGALITVQVFINEEMLFIVALSMSILLGAYALMRRGEVRPVIKPFLAGLGVAAAVAGVLVAYPLWRQFFGPESYRGLSPGLQSFGTDVAAIPALATRTLAGAFANNIHLATSPAEQNTFFGWPLLITLGGAIFWLRRNVWARALGITAAVLLVLSLGSVIIFNGHESSIPGPWALVKNLPIFDSVVPTRLGLFVLPILAVLVAMAHDHVLASTHRVQKVSGLDSKIATRSRQARLAWCFLVAVSLLAVFPTPIQTVPMASTPAFFTQGTWRNYVASDQTVVPVPLPAAGAVNSMFWAAGSDLAVQLPRGYFLGPDPAHDDIAIFGAPKRHTTELLDKVIAKNKPVVIKKADRAAAITDLRYWHAAVVIQLPDSPAEHAVRQTITDLLGFKPKFSGGVWVWDVRHLVTEQRAVSG